MWQRPVVSRDLQKAEFSCAKTLGDFNTDEPDSFEVTLSSAVVIVRECLVF